MGNNRPVVDPNQRLGVAAEIWRNLRLTWRLFVDKRVPLWVKAIPVVALGYIIWPFDLAWDTFLGLGQLDDLTIMLLALKLFVSVSPADVVAHHRALLHGAVAPGDEVVDTTYRVLDEEG